MKLPRFLSTIEGRFLVVVGIIILGLFLYYFSSQSEIAENQKADIAISANDHVRGALDGKVTLVKFVDFQCPACASYEPIVKQVLEENKSILKVVHKNFPLTQIHNNALPAALAAEAAGLQGKFWEMSDMLYAKQSEWGGSLTSRTYFMEYAKMVGLDMKKFEEDMSSKVLEEKVLSEFKEGVRLGVQGTPTFFLNGQKLSNPNSLDKFNQLIREAASQVSQ